MDKYVVKQVYNILITGYHGGYMDHYCKIHFNIFD